MAFAAKHPTAAILLLSTAALAFAACGDKDDTGEEDTGPDTYDGPVEITSYSYDVDTYIHEVAIETRGWTSSASLVITTEGSDQPLYQESGHPLTSYDYDDNGFWDKLVVQLDVVTGEAVLGETTLFTGGYIDDYTWRVDVYDTDESWAHCIAWGRYEPAVDPVGECTWPEDSW